MKMKNPMTRKKNFIVFILAAALAIRPFILQPSE